jgi:hypothetical protein
MKRVIKKGDRYYHQFAQDIVAFVTNVYVNPETGVNTIEYIRTGGSDKTSLPEHLFKNIYGNWSAKIGN